MVQQQTFVCAIRLNDVTRRMQCHITFKIGIRKTTYRTRTEAQGKCECWVRKLLPVPVRDSLANVRNEKADNLL